MNKDVLAKALGQAALDFESIKDRAYPGSVIADIAQRAETEIRAALAKHNAAPDGWQTMESAPKDGTHLILRVEWRDRPGFHEGFWCSDNNAWLVIRDGGNVQPKVPVTHFTYLPAPPVEGET